MMDTVKIIYMDLVFLNSKDKNASQQLLFTHYIKNYAKKN